MRTSFSVVKPSVWLGLAILAGLLQPLWSAPRLPLPPWPERHLREWRFDEALQQYPPGQWPAVIEEADLVEGWSGYALRRQGMTAVPFLIPEIESTNRVNFTCGAGAIRFWFRPNWGSPSEGGAGPGGYARLIELVGGGGATSVVWWSLYANPEGTALYWSGQGPTGPVDYLATELHWPADVWRLVTLVYSPTNSALYLDEELLAAGNGVAIPPVPSAINLTLVVGSDAAGTGLAQGQFDDVTSFDRVIGPWEMGFYHASAANLAALGPVSDEEIAWRQTALEEMAARSNALGGGIGGRFGGIQPNMLIVSNLADCITNVPVFITNSVATFITNQGWTVTFDVRGGTNGLLYDIFTTTNLTGDNLAAATWTWLERGPTCSSYEYTNQPGAGGFYVVGTPQDSDGDGLSDAYELLVSRTPKDVAQLVDSDGDGLPDWWETMHALDPWNASDATADPDRDGLTNVQEYLQGTDPHMAPAWTIWVATPRSGGNMP